MEIFSLNRGPSGRGVKRVDNKKRGVNMEQMETIVQGVGFESWNGYVWPDAFEDERSAKRWIEREVGMPWAELKKAAKMKMIPVEIRRAARD